MNFINAGHDTAKQPVELALQDWGHGPAVVLIHGWPLNHEMWEYQSLELAKNGFRTVAYTRRGFGDSSKPWKGYDYDTLADDLKAVLDGLDLQPGPKGSEGPKGQSVHMCRLRLTVRGSLGQARSDGSERADSI